MMGFYLMLIFAVVFSSGGRPSASFAGEIDWERIQPYETTLFYPGVASWEFLLSESHRLGAKNIKKGERACKDCHLDEETRKLDIAADEIASGKLGMKRSSQRFEPEPTPGKKGFLALNIRTAYDDEYFYLRLTWESSGSTWKDPQFAKEEIFDSVAIQLNKVQNAFQKYGCFISCHNDLISMPKPPSKKEIDRHPYYGALSREDIRLYAYYTRENGWSEMKSDGELNRLEKEGGLIDLWRMKFSGKKIVIEDWSIFSDRIKDKQADVEGSGHWEDGRYTVTVKRKLNTGDPKDVQLTQGDRVTLGISIHDDRSKLRKHYVSLPLSLGLGSPGDIKAVKTK